MAKEQDKVVAQIFETYDYEKFKVLPENRGHSETKGIKERKIETLQNLINTGQWIHAMTSVRVNENFEIINGAHTFEVCKRNGYSIRYEIIKDDHFNDVPKREKIGNIYSINSTNTSWTSKELFNAALQCKAPLALIMLEIIEANENYFLWTDLMALLEKDSTYFMGHWRKSNMKTFERKELIEKLAGEEFLLELKHFARFNIKARIATRKGIVLKAAYDILWHCRDMVDPKLFRKALASIPETVITSARMNSEANCARALIHYYNKSQGQKAETAAVLFAIKNIRRREEVLEIQ